MAVFILITLYSLGCGIAVFDAIFRSLPEANKLFIFLCQFSLCGVCGLVIFCLAFGVLLTIYLILLEVVKGVRKKKHGN